MVHRLRDLVGRLLCTAIDEAHELPPNRPNSASPGLSRLNHILEQRRPLPQADSTEDADSIMGPKRKSDSTVTADRPEKMAKPVKKSKKPDEEGTSVFPTLLYLLWFVPDAQRVRSWYTACRGLIPWLGCMNKGPMVGGGRGRLQSLRHAQEISQACPFTTVLHYHAPKSGL